MRANVVKWVEMDVITTECNTRINGTAVCELCLFNICGPTALQIALRGHNPFRPSDSQHLYKPLLRGIVETTESAGNRAAANIVEVTSWDGDWEVSL